MEVGKICPEHGINPETGRCKKGERNGRGQCVMNENGRCVKIQQVKRDSKSDKKTHKQHKALYENVSEDGIVRIEYLVSEIDNLLNFLLELDDEEKYQKVVDLWGPTMPREYLLTMSEAKQISKLDEKHGRGVMLGQTWKHVEMLHKNHFIIMDSADNDENHVGYISNMGGLAVTGSGSDVIIRVDDKLLKYAKSLTPVVKEMLDEEEKLDAKRQAKKMKEWLKKGSRDDDRLYKSSEEESDMKKSKKSKKQVAKKKKVTKKKVKSPPPEPKRSSSSSSSSNGKRTSAQKRDAKKMAHEITNVFWPVLKEAGERLHDFSEYYSVNPDNWSYPPQYLADSDSVSDYDMLKSNYNDMKADYDTVMAMGPKNKTVTQRYVFYKADGSPQKEWTIKYDPEHAGDQEYTVIYGAIGKKLTTKKLTSSRDKIMKLIASKVKKGYKSA